MLGPIQKQPYIINSLLDVDFYKFTMGQFIFNHFPHVHVRSAFINRTKDAALKKEIPEKVLRRELDHAMELRFTNTELHYLRGTNEYGERMFREPYLDFLHEFRLPPYELTYAGDDIRLEFPGNWVNQTYWETIGLSIVNELYFRSKMERLSPFQQDLVYAEGKIRLGKKINALTEIAGITVSDFGGRRRFSGDWHEYVVRTLAAELPKKQFKGTSNVRLAMEQGLMPTGTNGHELQMVVAAIQGNDDDLRDAPYKVMRLWWEMYGQGLSIILPDTFGSSYFFRTLSAEQAQHWKGFREDSDDPFKFGEQVLRFYKKKDVDPNEHMIIFSNQLNVPLMTRLYHRFGDEIGVTFGWGSDATNDLGFDQLSITVKPISVDGFPTVKLSDNLKGKSVGPEQVINRYRKVFGYDTPLVS